ncbi:MAG: hypothetical protein DDT29_00656 [Dehalococcoidia bacterium]|nr:hypothetical protein [Bacillota bacterium]
MEMLPQNLFARDDPGKTGGQAHFLWQHKGTAVLWPNPVLKPEPALSLYSTRRRPKHAV